VNLVDEAESVELIDELRDMGSQAKPFTSTHYGEKEDQKYDMRGKKLNKIFQTFKKNFVG
jgi:hypothetical protein